MADTSIADLRASTGVPRATVAPNNTTCVPRPRQKDSVFVSAKDPHRVHASGDRPGSSLQKARHPESRACCRLPMSPLTALTCRGVRGCLGSRGVALCRPLGQIQHGVNPDNTKPKALAALGAGLDTSACNDESPSSVRGPTAAAADCRHRYR